MINKLQQEIGQLVKGYKLNLVGLLAISLCCKPASSEDELNDRKGS